MPHLLSLETCTVDLEERLVLREGLPDRLTNKEAALLAYLHKRSPEPVSREELLERVWRYEPLVRSRTLDTTVHTLRAKIEGDPRSPVHVMTVRGVGYQLLGGRAMLATPAGLPPDDGSSFVGRRAELRQLLDSFEVGARLITILGTGGAGKTRLARRLGATPPPRFTAGVRFCDLTAVTDLPGLRSAVSRALELPPEIGEGDPIARALASAGPLLVVLDNFEQLVKHGPETVGAWCRAAPAVGFLVTSRARLRLAYEQTLELGPLQLPEEAATLFVDRARAARVTFAPPDDGTIADIVTLLDGLPLPIELAAARADMLTPRQILARLSARDERRQLPLLKLNWRDRSERRSTLRGALDWSWGLMADHERAALAQCSVFRGGFSPEAAEQVLDLSGAPEGVTALDVLRSLSDQSLLRLGEGRDGSPRCDMYLTIRAYASDQLGSEREAVERRHAAWCVSLGGGDVFQSVRSAGGSALLQRWDLEKENLTVALERAAAWEDPEIASPVAIMMASLALLGGPVSQVETFARAALDIPGLSEAEQARLLHLQVVGDWHIGRRSEAVRRNREALELAERAGDASSMTRSLLMVSHLGDTEELERTLTRCRALIDVLEARSDQLDLGMAWTALGPILLKLERPAEARAAWERALALHRAVGDQKFEGNVLQRLGSLHLAARGWDDAQRCFTEALMVSRVMGDRRLEATVLRCLSALAAGRGDLPLARSCCMDALELHRSMGSARGVAEDLLQLSELLERLGHDAEARSVALEGHSAAAGLGDPALTAPTALAAESELR